MPGEGRFRVRSTARLIVDREIPGSSTSSLERDLLLRTAEEHVSVSEAIRRAIGQYLRHRASAPGVERKPSTSESSAVVDEPARPRRGCPGWHTRRLSGWRTTLAASRSSCSSAVSSPSCLVRKQMSPMPAPLSTASQGHSVRGGPGGKVAFVVHPGTERQTHGGVCVLVHSTIHSPVEPGRTTRRFGAGGSSRSWAPWAPWRSPSRESAACCSRSVTPCTWGPCPHILGALASGAGGAPCRRFVDTSFGPSDGMGCRLFGLVETTITWYCED